MQCVRAAVHARSGGFGLVPHASEPRREISHPDLWLGVRDMEVWELTRFLFLCYVSERIYTLRKETDMPDSLTALEADRSKLLEEFLGLGDLRPGSITAVVRRCGKPTCHCAKP